MPIAIDMLNMFCRRSRAQPQRDKREREAGGDEQLGVEDEFGAWAWKAAVVGETAAADYIE